VKEKSVILKPIPEENKKKRRKKDKKKNGICFKSNNIKLDVSPNLDKGKKAGLRRHSQCPQVEVEPFVDPSEVLMMDSIPKNALPTFQNHVNDLEPIKGRRREDFFETEPANMKPRSWENY